jgi:hypothetical protein
MVGSSSWVGFRTALLLPVPCLSDPRAAGLKRGARKSADSARWLPGQVGLLGDLLNDPPGFERSRLAAVDARIVDFFDRQLGAAAP